MDLGIHLYGFLWPGWILDKGNSWLTCEMLVLHREGGGPWWSLEYTFMVSLGQGGSWIGRKFLVNLRNVCIPQRWWWTLVDLGYTFMVSLGQGGSWIGRKFSVNL